MLPAVEITERLLSEAGGWQALKEGRSLWEAGKVATAIYEPPFLRGTVRDGPKEYRTGLRIVTRTNIENLCSCRLSRERGMVCSHALAVGLAALKGTAPGSNPTAATHSKVVATSTPHESAPSRSAGEAPPNPQPENRLGSFSGADGPQATLHVVIAPTFTSGWEKDAVAIMFEIECRGKRQLADSFPLQPPIRLPDTDYAVLCAASDALSGATPGFVQLNREQACAILTLLQDHPRVTLGRGNPINTRELLQVKAVQSSLPYSTAVTYSSDQSLAPANPGLPAFSLHLEGSLNHLVAALTATYGDDRSLPATIRPGETFTYAAPTSSGATTRLTRNLGAERSGLDRLHAAGFTGPDTRHELILKGERSILRFLAGTLPALEREWKVTFGSRFSNISENLERVKPRLDIQSSGQNWFELSVTLGTSAGQTFSSAEIQRLLQMGQNHVRLANGRTALFDTGLLDELAQALADANPDQPRPGAYRIARAQAGYIQSVLGEGSAISAPPEWRQWTQMQLAPDQTTPVPLGPLEQILRPYQKHGVYWMHFLARNGFGGVLADEMGLGKTLQALAFLAETGPAEQKPSLIVCPSSLVQNWAREAARFTPALRVITLEGADRHMHWATLPTVHLAITSYALLRRDAERLRSQEFSTVILDEAQHIKNPETQNAQAATALRSRHRMVLTGTPLENSLRDLWSIMHFAMPGYLGTRADFKERYEQPILQGQGDALKARLAKRLRPFLLRRTKREVYQELPEKIQQVLYCTLSPRQAEVYDKLLAESRRQISELAGAKDQRKGRMLILTALLRLRQACCDLRLLGMEGLDQTQAAAKLDLLDELLREAIDGGHRVLIFSQFVKMLQLQKASLESASIPFCYLDGQTKDRMAAVDRFQNDPAIPVFLISLKAGGVGLNLTGADTVVHYDPWWNPAVEAQATDRAHRIGQQKVVTAYKLIARGTVEEKILKLQESKRDLMEAIDSEEPTMASLSTQEIQELLS